MRLTCAKLQVLDISYSSEVITLGLHYLLYHFSGSRRYERQKEKERHQCNAMYCYNGIYFWCIILFFQHLSVHKTFCFVAEMTRTKTSLFYLSAICHWLFVKSLANCFYLSSRCIFKIYFCCPKVHSRSSTQCNTVLKRCVFLPMLSQAENSPAWAEPKLRSRRGSTAN